MWFSLVDITFHCWQKHFKSSEAYLMDVAPNWDCFEWSIKNSVLNSTNMLYIRKYWINFSWIKTLFYIIFSFVICNGKIRRVLNLTYFWRYFKHQINILIQFILLQTHYLKCWLRDPLRYISNLFQSIFLKCLIFCILRVFTKWIVWQPLFQIVLFAANGLSVQLECYNHI